MVHVFDILCKILFIDVRSWGSPNYVGKQKQIIRARASMAFLNDIMAEGFFYKSIKFYK